MELPRLEPIYEKYKDQGFQIVAIDGQRMTDLAQQFIEENNLTFTFVETGEGEEDVARNTFGIELYPSMFLIDQEGVIRYFHHAFKAGDEEEIEKLVLSLLEE